MSNKDNDFRDFMDDDEESSGKDDFSDFDFGDDERDVDIDDNGDPFGITDDVNLDDGEGNEGFDQTQNEGGSRTFLYAAIALVIILLLCGGLILLQISTDILGLNAPITQTVRAIEETNVAVAALLQQTEAAGTAAFFASQTAEVANANATATAVVVNATGTASAEAAIIAGTATAEALAATQTAEFIANQTAQADSANQTATAIALSGGDTPTPEDGSPEPVATTPAGVPVGGIEAIQQTATALAEFRLNQQTATATLPAIGGQATPNPGQGGGGELPDTGLFDDLGNSPIALIFLGLALVAVIFLSRALRVANSSSK
jgi:hypothetical protein